MERPEILGDWEMTRAPCWPVGAAVSHEEVMAEAPRTQESFCGLCLLPGPQGRIGVGGHRAGSDQETRTSAGGVWTPTRSCHLPVSDSPRARVSAAVQPRARRGAGCVPVPRLPGPGEPWLPLDGRVQRVLPPTSSLESDPHQRLSPGLQVPLPGPQSDSKAPPKRLAWGPGSTPFMTPAGITGGTPESAGRCRVTPGGWASVHAGPGVG